MERKWESFVAMGAFVRGGDDIAWSVDTLQVIGQTSLHLEGLWAVGTGVWSLCFVYLCVTLKYVRPDKAGTTSLYVNKKMFYN